MQGIGLTRLGAQVIAFVAVYATATPTMCLTTSVLDPGVSSLAVIQGVGPGPVPASKAGGTRPCGDGNATAPADHSTATPGVAYRIGRLEFVGNKRVRDRALYRAFGVKSGSRFASSAISRGMARLNRMSGLRHVEPSDIVLAFCDHNSVVDITIRVTDD
jgi:hypothetical protein